MKKNPYTSSTGNIHARDTRGKRLIKKAAITRTKLNQRILPRSLNPPKSGLLMADARKIPDSAKPVNLESNPWACCRKSELKLPIPLPAKSRRLNAKLAARKNSHKAAV